VAAASWAASALCGTGSELPRADLDAFQCLLGSEGDEDCGEVIRRVVGVQVRKMSREKTCSEWVFCCPARVGQLEGWERGPAGVPACGCRCWAERALVQRLLCSFRVLQTPPCPAPSESVRVAGLHSACWFSPRFPFLFPKRLQNPHVKCPCSSCSCLHSPSWGGWQASWATSSEGVE